MVVRVELVLVLTYCRCETKEMCVVVNAEMLLLSNYCCGSRHVCVVVGVELAMSWS